jgi:plastocyanin
MRRAVLVFLVLLCAPACSDDGGGGAGRVEMTADQAFRPTTITVAAGDSVTWDNASGEQHTVTAKEDSLPDDAGYFASGGASSEDESNDDLAAGFVGPGERYSYTFETPGTYRYYCIPHRGAGMTGTVVVTAD